MLPFQLNAEISIFVSREAPPYPDEPDSGKTLIVSLEEVSMLMKIITFFIGIMFFCVLAGCGFNIASHMRPLLDPKYLDEKTGTAKINLAENGQCPTVTLPVNPVNIETRTEEYVIYNMAGTHHYFEPKEFIEYTVQYLKKKLIESNLKVDHQSGKKILVSLEEAKSNGSWTLETSIKLKIELPEINYSQIYSGVEGSAYQHNASAYALHLSIQKFLNDPVFQGYVKCH